ncbi:uncharacterized protein ACN63O_002052 [Diretmus argenteus]
MYTSENVTSCAYSCEMIRRVDMCYDVGCSNSCAEACVNNSQTNCSVQCCNSTGCLNLKKETLSSIVTWTAGCTTNCSGQTWCKPPSTPKCHLECCNATSTSCLFLNGTLNVPSFATRGPHLRTELIAFLVFCISLLM